LENAKTRLSLVPFKPGARVPGRPRGEQLVALHFCTAAQHSPVVNEPSVGSELSIDLVDTDPELGVVAIAGEQALKGKGFAKAGGIFHPFRCRLDRPGESVDRRTPLPLAGSPSAERFEIAPAQACLANHQCHEGVHKQAPV
jgi:hypothetical protein